MSEIHNTGSMGPRERKLYEQEYREGAGLFEKALNQRVKSNYGAQEHQFNEVMRKAMEVLNQTARQLKRDDLIRQNEKIEKDYQAYQKDPNKEHAKALKSDLEQARKFITP